MPHFSKSVFPENPDTLPLIINNLTKPENDTKNLQSSLRLLTIPPKTPKINETNTIQMNKTNERTQMDTAEMDRTNISVAKRDRMGRCAGVTPRLPINPSPRLNTPRHPSGISNFKTETDQTQEGETQNRDGARVSGKKIFPYNLYYVN